MCVFPGRDPRIILAAGGPSASEPNRPTAQPFRPAIQQRGLIGQTLSVFAEAIDHLNADGIVYRITKSSDSKANSRGISKRAGP